MVLSTRQLLLVSVVSGPGTERKNVWSLLARGKSSAQDARSVNMRTSDPSEGSAKAPPAGELEPWATSAGQ